MGRLIASRLPGNSVGWLLCLTGLSLAATMLTEQYALYGLATAPGSVPAARLAGWCSDVLAALTLVQLLFLVLLFPDGRLPSHRWRPVLWALFVVVAGAVAGQMQVGTTVSGGITDSLAIEGVSYRNPLGIIPRHSWSSDLFAMIVVLAVVTGVLAVASVFIRRRGASTERRKQLAWLGYVGLLTAVWGVALDPRNFHRKVTGTPGYVLPAGGTTTRQGVRPAQLFKRGDVTLLNPPMLRPA